MLEQIAARTELTIPQVERALEDGRLNGFLVLKREIGTDDYTLCLSYPVHTNFQIGDDRKSNGGSAMVVYTQNDSMPLAEQIAWATEEDSK